ncbi:MAG: homocysteine S-methyltransferase family protein [Candidatus Latescibacterota bacterium]
MADDIRLALGGPGLILGDGGMGWYLTAQGLLPGAPCEVWNAERPEVVRDHLQAFLRAGARVLTANTLTANRLHHPEIAPGRLMDLARRGVELARQVAGSAAWVAGDMGPTGRLLAPFGETTVAQAEEAYAEQAAALAEAGANLILFETMTDVAEARAGVCAALAATNLPVAVTFALDVRARTPMGQTAAAAAQAMEAAGACATGANCGAGPEAVLAGIRQMREATRLPLIAQPNAGVPRLEGSRTQWDIGVEGFRQVAGELAVLGARWIGGCCGTTAEHVRVAGEALAGARRRAGGGAAV